MSGADRVRQAAQWQIAAFAAVGAALVAGVPLSNLGAVHDTGRVILAFGAAGLALAGIVLGITSIGRVLDPAEATTRKLVDSQELARRVEEEHGFLGGFGHETVADVVRDHSRAFTAYRDAQRQTWEHPGEEANSELARRTEEYEELDTIVNFLRRVQQYETTKKAFSRARKRVIASAFLAFFGLLLFAYEANPPKPAPHAVKGPKGDHGVKGPMGPRGPRGRVGEESP